MAEEHSEREIAEDLPVAEVHPKKGISIIWLIPLLALAIGGWLTYKSWSERGPKVTVTFKSAEGLVAGKTKVKFKDVEVGQVEEITLSEDFSEVVVRIQMVHGVEKYMTDQTRFWVVKARVGGGQVTGLGTLFSGAYIEVDPVANGNHLTKFTGLDDIPMVKAETPGRLFNLKAEQLGSLDIGSPVYYRGIRVGKVVQYGFDKSGQAVDIKVFIDAPHDRQVTSTTRFWNASGIDLNVNASGLKVDTQSLLSIMLGGIAFDLPPYGRPGQSVEDPFEFKLYANHDAISEEKFTFRNFFLMRFNQSVRGLSRGAPVEYRGIKVGEVVDIQGNFLKNDGSPENNDFSIPVTAAIEPERIYGKGTRGSDDYDLLRSFIRHGLRAVLRSGNLLTGQLYVDLDLYPEAPAKELTFEEELPVIPTRQTELREFTETLSSIAKKLERVPVEEIGEELHQTIQEAKVVMQQINQLTQRLDSETAPALTATLAQLRSTLADLETGVGSESEVNHELSQTLKELSASARSLRSLTDYLAQHPESLIYGKGGSNHE